MDDERWRCDPDYRALLEQRARQRRLLRSIPKRILDAARPTWHISASANDAERIETRLRAQVDVRQGNAFQWLPPWLKQADSRRGADLVNNAIGRRETSTLPSWLAQLLDELEAERNATPDAGPLDKSQEDALFALAVLLAWADEAAGDLVEEQKG